MARLTHIIGTFLIKAEGAFLNGAVSEDYKGNKITTPKRMQEFNNKIPYVSAQAWRHWLRETYKEEYPNDLTTPIETTGIDAGEAKEKYTTKKVGTNVDPILFAEHDIFGYMTTKEDQGTKGVKATIRSAPFQSSILMSVRKSGWEGIDEGFVYPKSVAISFYRERLDELIKESDISDKCKKKIEDMDSVLTQDISREELVEKLAEGLQAVLAQAINDKEKDKIKLALRKITLTVPTSLPYQTRFYNTHLQGIFGLAYHRIGLFRNSGDREELEKTLVTKYLKDGQIEKITTNDKNVIAYKMTNKKEPIERTKKILRSLAVLRGGAKQAQFGTDVSPKVIIIAGLTCGNLIFNDLFEDTKELVTSPREQTKGSDIEFVASNVMGGTCLKLNTLKQIIFDYAERIVTPVYIGIRSGYLSRASETELIKWVESGDKWQKDAFENKITPKQCLPEIILTSPVDAVQKLLDKLEIGNGDT
jgi:CRISPR/Cas system-associated protein Cas7 (RAMP superfamily)